MSPEPQTSLIRTLHRVARDPSPVSREMFLASLMRDGPLHAADLLVDCLHECDGRVLALAMDSLWALRGAGALPIFKRAMLLGDLEVRRQAAAMLERVGPPAVLDLCDMLRHPTWDIRARAVEVLGRIGDPRGVGPLCRRLEDEHELIRIRAARALGAIASPEAERALCRAVSDPSDQVKLSAVAALERLPGVECAAVLVPLLTGKIPADLRIAAVRVLAAQGWSPGEPDTEAAVYFRLSLGRVREVVALGGPAIPLLLGWLRSGEPPIQRRCVHAVWEMAREYPTPQLHTVVPTLRYLARYGHADVAPDARRAAIFIQRAVAQSRGLPLPSREPDPDPRVLPRPVEPGFTESRGLPVPVLGPVADAPTASLRRRLLRWLWGSRR